MSKFGPPWGLGLLEYCYIKLTPSIHSWTVGPAQKWSLFINFSHVDQFFSFWWSVFEIFAQIAYFEKLWQPQVQWDKHMCKKISNGTWQNTYLSTIGLPEALFGMWDNLILHFWGFLDRNDLKDSPSAPIFQEQWVRSFWIFLLMI